LRDETPKATLRQACAAWVESRIDAAESTKTYYETSLNRALLILGERRLDTLSKADMDFLVKALHEKGKKQKTIRKTLQNLAQVFDQHGFDPNPARNVRVPREEPEEMNPPTASDVEAVWLLPSVHRLAFLWLEASGQRVAAVNKTLVGDYDERNRRVLIRKNTTKTRKPVWHDLPDALADAIEAALPPREDRNLAARLFAGSGSDALRTAMAKACAAAGIPHFHPHDLRHRASASWRTRASRLSTSLSL
jgi:integrase